MYICFVIQVLLISQTQLENSMKSLTILWPFLVNIQMRCLHCTLLKVVASALLYGCEVWHLNDMQKISVAWNNCFRRFFSRCRGESVKPLQYFCHTLPIQYNCYTSANYCFGKMYCSDSVVLQSLSRRIGFCCCW